MAYLNLLDLNTIKPTWL
ncbi:uncharacterized protein FFB20_11790 [Fusarium fujikuroi]|nr:uncharacterized protein FFC1_03617 [Fusarium fujikuroi]SCO02918.1 uncharacterized protein FFB20_11790 [Fusarium fujikuroi]SCO32766.1 uncharacterized protein FFNC_03073 [Fusarium fujikuroi]